MTFLRFSREKLCPLLDNNFISEYWIGLEKLYNLTTHNCPWQMNVTLWDQNNKTFSAMYDKFYVGPPPTYQVFAYGFYSPGDGPRDKLKDAFFYNMNSSFTTFDKDQV